MTEPRTIDIEPGSAIPIMGAVIALGVVVFVGNSVQRTLTATIVGVLIALALNPLVVKVQSLTHWPRREAVVVVLLCFVLAVVSVITLVLPSAIAQAKEIPSELPKSLEQLGDLPIVGQSIRNNDVPRKIEDALDKLPGQVLSSRDSSFVSLANTFADGVWAAFLVLLVAITALLDGERLVRGLGSMVPRQRRPMANELGKLFYEVIGRYFAGSVFIAIIAGTVVTTAGLILRVPLAPLLGMWVTLTNLIPQIGGALGGVPFVVFAFTRSPLTGVLAVAVFVTYQQIENHILGPLVAGKTVKLSPPVTMGAALIGVSAAGVIGALFAVPFCGVVKAVYLYFHPDLRVE